MKWLFRWMFDDELMTEYMRGWSAGVKQHMYEPESCKPISWIDGDSWPSEQIYQYGED